MSIMDKDFFIKFYTTFKKDHIDIQDANIVIRDYCLEHNKNIEDINKLLHVLSRNFFIFADILEHVCIYYINKYSLIIISDSETNTFIKIY